jgi:vacuolar-type H+-ATPase subunit I/STV1
MEIGIILGWLISSIIIGAIGSTRKIGFFGAFALSLLLSPLIGLIISLVSKSKSDLEYQETLLNTLNQQKEISEKESNQKNISKITDELRKIKDLLDNEVINQDEFEKIKKRLVESIDSNNKTEDSSSILDSNKKYDPQKYFDGKLDIPKVISRNKNKRVPFKKWQFEV